MKYYRLTSQGFFPVTSSSYATHAFPEGVEVAGDKVFLPEQPLSVADVEGIVRRILSEGQNK